LSSAKPEKPTFSLNMEDELVEEGDAGDLEGDKNVYQTSFKEKVYYNDEIYMTSQGAELTPDELQEKILKKLRGDVLDKEFEVR
jgi:hypothetical protein